VIQLKKNERSDFMGYWVKPCSNSISTKDIWELQEKTKLAKNLTELDGILCEFESKLNLVTRTYEALSIG